MHSPSPLFGATTTRCRAAAPLRPLGPFRASVYLSTASIKSSILPLDFEHITFLNKI